MATENNRIVASELDFDQIKANLKEFFRGQDQFSDYDFEGSGLSVLIDILAYNTHYNSLYKNLTVNELFLDSAVLRSSVVSRAKELGYTPHSAKCSTAVLNLTVTNPTSFPSAVTLPKHSPFTSTVDGTTYTFYTIENISISYNNGYFFENVNVIEGTPLTYRYTVSDATRYIIPNNNVDLDTLTIKVQDSASSSNFDNYVRASSILDIGSTDKIFFIKEIEGQLYEVIFGDGVIGKKLTNGNVVTLDYFVCNLDKPNTAKVFSYAGTPLIGGSLNVATVTPAYGGSDLETIESIKYNAPRSYAAQNRAVTIEDYKTILYRNFTDSDSIAVWGGEDNSPPVYGKVFVCIKPKDQLVLTTQQKDYVQSILDKYSVATVIPEIVDPDYLNIHMSVTFYYDDRKTSRSANDLAQLVRTTVTNYNTNELQKFDGIYRNSKMTRLIDTTEPSIINSHVLFTVHRSVTPRFDTNAEYIVNIINPIYNEGVPEEAVSSNGFYIQNSTAVHYLQDDGVGNIQLYYLDDSANKIIVNPTLGSVDYAAGIVTLRNLNISSLYGDSFELIFKTQSYDVVSALTQIVQIQEDALSITAIADATASGNFAAGNNFIFTSSRN